MKKVIFAILITVVSTVIFALMIAVVSLAAFAGSTDIKTEIKKEPKTNAIILILSGNVIDEV